MATSDGIEVSESEWESLARNWPPVVLREDGSLLVIAGKWSEGKRTYDYASLEVVSQTPASVGPEVAQSLKSARGKDVEEFRSDCDAGYDGTRYRSATEQSRITVWWIAAGVPTRLKCGQTYTSSGSIHYGGSKVHFYGGPASAPAYRSQSQKFKKAHEADLNAPPPPTARQAEILGKYVARAVSWGFTGCRVPATAVGAKRVLDELAENGWKLGDRGGPDPMSTWKRVIATEDSPPRPREPEAPVPVKRRTI